jgi:pimeloyl-ACP methyl ester carboxylesterase
LFEDVEDIRDVLVTSDLDQVDVVAWGYGGRTAIALARRLPEQVSSLLLVSPSFYGARAADKYPSPFEDFLVEAYEIARQDRVSAWSLIKGLPQLGMWNARTGSLPSDSRRRVQSVLRLPPQACLTALFAPFACAEYFQNYVQRFQEDGLFDVAAALWEVRCPIVLVSGTHDAAVNTHLARDMLATYGSDVLQATLSGAGHHIQVLQYGYLRYLLDSLAARSAPVSTARLRVERLA